MKDCWHTVPQMRPSFAALEERMGSMLEDDVKLVRKSNAIINLVTDESTTSAMLNFNR
jgi:hypothetical protein